MTDKMREEFEAWVISKWPETDLGQFNDGEYCGFTLAHCWSAWQASREALVIELPDADGLNREHMLVQGFLEGVAHTRVAIEAAGLKVKS
ncbi:hypothetical protein [Pseudomonas sp. D3-10]|uniref:hypothetical protein n=1 Tax=Pseudomonas sp. D3-10 TaxID=2817392 RepID=UPI003DAA07E3